MKKINYIELGATLFVPSTHKDLNAIITEDKYSGLKSVLIDTEDGINEHDLEFGLSSLREVLRGYTRNKLLVFIRPRNPEILKEILSFENIEEINGFILPKFSLLNAQEYFDVLKPYDFSLMPSIEGKELFDHVKLNKLRDIILTNAHKITLVRYGLEDTLRQLRMKRSCLQSAFDYSAINAILGNFIATFKSVGFAVSGGVYPCFKDDSGFLKDVKRDLKEGLFSKTIIHPKQINVVNELYKVTQKEFEEALAIFKSEEAVFNLDGAMAESVTMRPYSEEVILRAEIYGIKEEV